MRRRGTASLWVLPSGPDVLRMLFEQARSTGEGLDAFASWAAGDVTQAERVREAEHACDHQRRAVLEAVRDAFATPLEPEDLFRLSQGLDRVINAAKDTVREAEAMSVSPDAFVADMAALVRDGVHHLVAAIDDLDPRALATAPRTPHADAAVKCQRQVEKAYRAAICELLENDDLRAAIGLREMYRRLAAMSDDVVGVAERLTYAVLKQA